MSTATETGTGWRDTVKGRSVDGRSLVGKFRDACFVAPASNGTFGRRVEVHEYPQRDLPWVEDLGRKARSFTIEVFVDGRLGDYLAARDALIAALEESGPGTLLHPWYGAMTVVLAEPATVRENTRDGGRASFRLVFVEAGELRFPSSDVDTVALVESKADDALAAATDDFAETFDPDGLPGWSLAELADDLYDTISEVEALVAGVTGPIAALIRTPANMAAAIMGAVQRLYDIATEPLRALQLYKRLFGAGNDTASGGSTAIARQQAQSSAAMHRLTRQVAVIEACRSASRADYESRTAARAAETTLLDALDDQMTTVDPVNGRPICDSVYQALADLRGAVTDDLRTRGGMLPDLDYYTPAATMPALVIAYLVYGDASRDGEIIGRNRIRHPGFVPGGEVLEVLNV